MKRQDIQLLAAARQGDASARCEVGRRYLVGSAGFPRHQPTAIGYLSHPTLRDSAVAAQIIAEEMALEDIVLAGQEATLLRAGLDGSRTAQLKLAALRLIREGEFHAFDTIRRDEGAEADPSALFAASGNEQTTHLLRRLCANGRANLPVLNLLAAKEALASNDLTALVRCLRTAAELEELADAEVADITTKALRLAETHNYRIQGVPAKWIRTVLQTACEQGHPEAAYTLGRAMCGMACGPLAPSDISDQYNVRKGSALLLMAADGGITDAWICLYRLHSEKRLSLLNPPMALFFLGKAASCGAVHAQRMIGTLLLRDAECPSQCDRALEWLFRAANAGDSLARRLLESLVLRLPGDNQEVEVALEELGRHDRSFAALLRLSREFGLTKREAFTVDPADGLRPWGLMVAHNPFISQCRMAAPRPVPALTDSALLGLQRAAALSGRSKRWGSANVPDYRRAVRRKHRVFRRFGLKEEAFFATAPSSVLETMRGGRRWASRFRDLIEEALAT